jgi:hypothetical protein
MIRVELKWIVWLILALVVYMLWKGPSDMGAVFAGIVHLFERVGNALLRGVGAVRSRG